MQIKALNSETYLKMIVESMIFESEEAVIFQGITSVNFKIVKHSKAYQSYDRSPQIFF